MGNLPSLPWCLELEFCRWNTLGDCLECLSFFPLKIPEIPWISLKLLETLHKTLKTCGNCCGNSLELSRIGISTVKKLEALYAGVDSIQPYLLEIEVKLSHF